MKFWLLILQSNSEKFCKKIDNINKEIQRVKNKTIKPTKEVNELLQKYKSSTIEVGVKLADLVKRTELTYDKLYLIDIERPELSKQEKEEIEIQIKYEGYIKLQIGQVEKFKKLESKTLLENIDIGLNLFNFCLASKLSPFNLE